MNYFNFQKVSRILCSRCKTPIDLSAQEPLSKMNCPACGVVTRVPMIFGKYLVLKQLSEDAASVRFRAVDRELHRQVALKILRTETVVKKPGFNWRQLMKHSLREARLLSTINHPNVMKVFLLGNVEKQPFVETELYEGHTLLDKMNPRRKLPGEAEVLQLGLQLVSGLEAAQKADLRHLDLSPERIRFCKEGQAKLTDFAMDPSRIIDSLLSREAKTLDYIAPELVLSLERKMQVGIQADMYSLGAILFHYLTGHPAFLSQSADQILENRYAGPAPRASEFRQDLDPETVSLIQTLMKRDPRKRFKSYSQLADCMVQTLNHLILSQEEEVSEEVDLSQESDSVISLAAAVEDSPRTRNQRTSIRRASARSMVKGKARRSG